MFDIQNIFILAVDVNYFLANCDITARNFRKTVKIEHKHACTHIRACLDTYWDRKRREGPYQS